MKGLEQFWDGKISQDTVPAIREKVLKFNGQKGRVIWTEQGQYGKIIWDGVLKDDAETMKGLETAVLTHQNERGHLSWGA